MEGIVAFEDGVHRVAGVDGEHVDVPERDGEPRRLLGSARRSLVGALALLDDHASVEDSLDQIDEIVREAERRA